MKFNKWTLALATAGVVRLAKVTPLNDEMEIPQGKTDEAHPSNINKQLKSA